MLLLLASRKMISSPALPNCNKVRAAPIGIVNQIGHDQRLIQDFKVGVVAKFSLKASGCSWR